MSAAPTPAFARAEEAAKRPGAGLGRTLGLLAIDFPPAHGGIQTLSAEIYTRLSDLVRVVVAPALDPKLATKAVAGSGPDLSPYSDLDPSPSPDLGLPVIRTRRPSSRGLHTLAYLREAAALLRPYRTPPFLLHCNHLFAGYAAWWLRVRYAIPYLVWVHGEELTKSRYSALVRSSLSGASAIIANSSFTAEQARRYLRDNAPPPIYVVPLGAPAAWLAAAPAPARIPAVPVILTVARLSRRDRYKGIDTALRAMAELRRRGRAFQYRIAGDGDDRGYLEKLARELGLGAEVEFLGRVPQEDMMALVDDCDIFLLASRAQRTPRGIGYEGFGIVLVEAGARAKPVVAGRSGGVVDAVSDGESGLLADPDSPQAIAQALESLLASPELRRRLGAGGRARAESRFNWDEAARQVREIHDRHCRAR